MTRRARQRAVRPGPSDSTSGQAAHGRSSSVTVPLAPQFSWQLAFLWAGLVSVTLAVYQPAWHGAPVWDDDAHMTPTALQSVDGLRRIWFETGASQQYYPVVHTAFWIMHRLWGDATTGHHLVNIVLHATSAWLIAILLARLSIAGALFAAFAFALHPVQVESVAWITELKNTLSTVFYLAAAFCYVRFGETRDDGFRRRSFALFVLALGCKTVTATLPVALLVLAWWKHGRLIWSRDVRPLVPFFLTGLAAGATTAWMEYTFIGARGIEFQLTAIERALLAGRAVWFYLSSLVWPSNLVFIYPQWQLSAAVWWQYLFPLALAAAFLLLWRIRRRARAPVAALLLYTVGLGPALGFVNVYPFRYSYVADHFQYTASVAMIAVLAAALTTVARRWIPSAPARTVLAVAALVPLAVLSWKHAHQYVDRETLYRATIARNPSAWMAHVNLAAMRLEGDQPNPGEASAHLRDALRANPRSPEVHNLLGLFLLHEGQMAEARQALDTALRLHPTLSGIHTNLGVLAYSEGRLDDAARHYRDAIQFDPRDPEPRRNLAIVVAALGGSPSGSLAASGESPGTAQMGADELEQMGRLAMEQGRLADAITHFEAVRQLQPGVVDVRLKLGAAYEATGRLDEAGAAYREAARIDPRSAEAKDNLGYLLVRQKRFGEAVPLLAEAIRLRPDFAPSHASLAGALWEVGRLDESIAAYRRALEFPENAASADVHNNYGIALGLRGRTAEAATEFREALRLNPNLVEARRNLDLLQKRP
jgi:Flp pilus assembly protein TadD